MGNGGMEIEAKIWKWVSLSKKAEKFHESNRGLDFTLLIDPYNRIGWGHDNFPDDFLDDLIGSEKAILWHFGEVALLFQLYKVTCTHPQVVNVPAFKNISEIFSKQQSNKDSVWTNNIDPAAVMPISHELKGLPQGSVWLNLDVFDTDVLEKG